VVIFTSRPFYPQGKNSRYPFGGWVGPRHDMVAVVKRKNSFTCREPNSSRPGCNSVTTLNALSHLTSRGSEGYKTLCTFSTIVSQRLISKYTYKILHAIQGNHFNAHKTSLFHYSYSNQFALRLERTASTSKKKVKCLTPRAILRCTQYTTEKR
jgi:hypothetical protein